MAHLAKIGFGILLTVIGLVAGRFLAGSSGASTHEGLGEEAPAAAGPKVIPPQTLKSMGVTVGQGQAQATSSSPARCRPSSPTGPSTSAPSRRRSGGSSRGSTRARARS